MNMPYRIHQIISFLINLVIIVFIVYATARNNTDKSPGSLWVLYMILLTTNSVVLFVLRLVKSKQAKIYQQALIGLLFMFVPIVIYLSTIP